MKIIAESLTLKELSNMALNIFGNMVKAVVDVESGLLAVDAELHSDLEALLLENGSKQKNLWGINLYPDMEKNEFVEFDSLINIRPSQENRSRGVENEATRNKIIGIIEVRIKR